MTVAFNLTVQLQVSAVEICGQLQCLSPSKPRNRESHKALRILEKNLTKWWVEAESTHFFAKIDHWVECLKHVSLFFFQMVAPCIPSNLSHGPWYLCFSKNPKQKVVVRWGCFSYKRVATHTSPMIKSCIISTFCSSPFHSEIESDSSSPPSVLRSFWHGILQKPVPNIQRLWGSDLTHSVTSQLRRLLTSEFVLRSTKLESSGLVIPGRYPPWN